MDFELTADQEDLQEGVRKLCQGRFPMSRVRAAAATAGVDLERWDELAEAGVFDLRRPEADGGVGLGTAEAALVFTELGRALVPGPLVATHLAAGLVDDARVVGVVEPVRTPVVVENLQALDAVVVVDGDRLRAVAAAEVEATLFDHPLDVLTPPSRVTHLPEGGVVGGAEDAARWSRDGAVLTAAYLLGIAEATTEMAVDYAKQRQQFDRPIGSFQAVKHLLADMYVRAEIARAAVHAAAVTIDQPDVGDPDRAAHAAKLLAGEAAVVNGKTCIQVHGGMGFTWEVDAQLYVKRAWVLDQRFGTADEHAAAMGAALLA